MRSTTTMIAAFLLAGCGFAHAASPANGGSANKRKAKPLLSSPHVQVQKQALKVEGKTIRKSLRTSLLVRCSRQKKTIKPLFDVRGKISLLSREHRIAQVRLKRRALSRFSKRLEKALKQRAQDRKMMSTGYAVSKGLRTVALIAVNRLLGEASWLGVLLPTSVNVVSGRLQIEEKSLPRPSELRLKPMQAMDRILRLVQQRQNPGIYKGVICYLTSQKLRLGKTMCKPDHPFVLNEYKHFQASWKENKRILKKKTFSKWSAPLLEFLTQHEGVIIRQEEAFIKGLRNLMRQQSGFLGEVEKALLQDYRAWGCLQAQKQ